jgi:trk system potassium uptake protein TrkH
MPFSRSLVPASSLAQQRRLSVTGLWAIGRIFGVLLTLFSLTMLVPLAVSWGYRDGEAASFLLTFGMTFTLGLALWLPLRQVHAELRTRDGFIIVALFWIVLGLVSALPFVIGPHLGYTDSVFEAVSAFTTTGATTLVGPGQVSANFVPLSAAVKWLLVLLAPTLWRV